MCPHSADDQKQLTGGKSHHCETGFVKRVCRVEKQVKFGGKYASCYFVSLLLMLSYRFSHLLDIVSVDAWASLRFPAYQEYTFEYKAARKSHYKLLHHRHFFDFELLLARV